MMFDFVKRFMPKVVTYGGGDKRPKTELEAMCERISEMSPDEVKRALESRYKLSRADLVDMCMSPRDDGPGRKDRRN